MDSKQAITFRPGPDAALLEAAAFVLGVSRNEALRQALHVLAKQEPRIREAMQTLAKSKEEF